jgi:hypothetical protein
MRFVVVGAGIGGSAFTRVARGAGHEVVLISDQDKIHSLAATAVLRRGYHKGPEAATWDESMSFYRAWNIPLVSGAYVTNYRTPDKAEHFDKDWHLIDPAAPLLAPDVLTRVNTIYDGSVATPSGAVYTGDAVILAPGTSPYALDGKVTWGVTWVHPDPGVLRRPEALQVHHWAPYKSIVAGPVGRRARLGSSSASTVESAHAQARVMLAAARDIGMIHSTVGWSAETGARLQTKEHHARYMGKRTWWFGGFHRTGYALAPSLAHRLISKLEAL